ncbi:NAD-binding protein, partial [Klebsiella aerogenes]|uniref:NAD-binding protein n=1 Tax=Klebsiella aerogenes TaxID=548 RepID=UPI0038783FCE
MNFHTHAFNLTLQLLAAHLVELLGLEAAGALKNLGVETHVIEFAPMLMAEQLDQMGGEQLKRKIESMGVKVHT